MIKLVLIPLLTAFIGYITVIIAVEMLFKPREPVNILGLKIQGLFPSQHANWAAKAGETVESSFSLDELIVKVDTPENHAKAADLISQKVREKISEVIPKIVPPTITRTVADKLEGMIRKEIPSYFNQAIAAGRKEFEEKVNIKALVEQKVLELDLLELERMLKESAGRDIRIIALVAGFFGLVIGILQDLIIIFIP
ncbi:MAG: DUF445 domain-containing protein [Candidatus Saccharibacteria bacterium]